MYRTWLMMRYLPSRTGLRPITEYSAICSSPSLIPLTALFKRNTFATKDVKRTANGQVNLAAAQFLY